VGTVGTGFRIFFAAARPTALRRVVLSSDRDWQVIALGQSLIEPLYFVLEGPAGDYAGANGLAKTVELYVPEVQASTSETGRVESHVKQ